MHRIVATLILAALAVAAPPSAEAQPAAPEVSDAEREMALEMERVDAMAKAIEEALGVFIVHPERREALEGVVIKGKRAEVWFLRPLKVSIEAARCDAFRWLLTGRLAGASGIGPVFKAWPELEQVTLVFYAVETEVNPDGRGGYSQRRGAVRHLEVTLSRERSLSLDHGRLRRTLAGDYDACVKAGQQLVDHFWAIR